jgi:carbamoyltransferase
MPFAPVVLKEHARDYLVNFNEDCSLAAEYMTVTYDVTPKCSETAPAITHVDKTARPQIVTEAINPSYYKILKEYKKLTGHSILVNTSFNMHEEPIVRTPEEALSAFEQSKIHALAMGNFIVEVDWNKRN